MTEILCGIDLGTTNSSIAYLKDGKAIAISRWRKDRQSCPPWSAWMKMSGRNRCGKAGKKQAGRFSRTYGPLRQKAHGKGNEDFPGSKGVFLRRKSLPLSSGICPGGQANSGPADSKDRHHRARLFQRCPKAGYDPGRANWPAWKWFGSSMSRLRPRWSTIARLSWRRKIPPYLMVYDLGGGTFDVSILEIKGEIKEVLASCGDTVLGGDDFDERLLNHFLRHLKEKTGFDFSELSKSLHVRVKDIAEKTKISLSDAPYVRVQEVAVATLNGQAVNLELEVGRREYEEMIADLVEKTIQKMEEALTGGPSFRRRISEKSSWWEEPPALLWCSGGWPRFSNARSIIPSIPTSASPWERPSKAVSSPASRSAIFSWTSPPILSA